jgi:hypothetical protein
MHATVDCFLEILDFFLSATIEQFEPKLRKSGLWSGIAAKQF